MVFRMGFILLVVAVATLSSVWGANISPPLTNGSDTSTKVVRAENGTTGTNGTALQSEDGKGNSTSQEGFFANILHKLEHAGCTLVGGCNNSTNKTNEGEKPIGGPERSDLETPVPTNTTTTTTTTTSSRPLPEDKKPEP